MDSVQFEDIRDRYTNDTVIIDTYVAHISLGVRKNSNEILKILVNFDINTKL